MTPHDRERIAALPLPPALRKDAWWLVPIQPAAVVVVLDDYRQRPEETATSRWPQ